MPLDVMYEERGIHEIVFPCDDPKKNDYTFVLTVGVSVKCCWLWKVLWLDELI